MFYPRGTPALVAKLNAAIKKRSTDGSEGVRPRGRDPVASTPEQLATRENEMKVREGDPVRDIHRLGDPGIRRSRAPGGRP